MLTMPIADDALQPATQQTRRVALTAADLPELRPDFAVYEGDHVVAGQLLLRDRKRPRIRVVAPVSGVVESLRYGPRRRFGLAVIRRDADMAPEPSAIPARPLRETLLDRGMWPMFLTRPFGRLPDPDAQPDAILVSGPDRALGDDLPQDWWDRLQDGLRLISGLTEGPVLLGQRDIPQGTRAEGRLRFVRHHAGPTLAHALHRLHSVADGRTVWTIDPQDVVAIAELVATGRADPLRRIALSGAESRVLRLQPGADLHEFARTHGLALRSGKDDARWLGLRARQIDPAPQAVARRGGLLRPIVPLAAFDAVLPRGMRAVPLMRALSIGDVETAQRLGCLDLLEDDVAALTALCASGADYGRLLRRVLDELEAS